MNLQRTVGNRAVNRLLGSGGGWKPAASPPALANSYGGNTAQIQRVMGPEEIHNYRDRIGRSSQTIKVIRAVLAEYHATQITYDKMNAIAFVKVVAQGWLDKHGTSSKTAADLQKLVGEATTDLKTQAQKLGEQKKLSEKGAATTGSKYLGKYNQFGYLGATAEMAAKPQAEYFSKLKSDEKAKPDMQKGIPSQDIAEGMQKWQEKYKLPEEELTAIKTYTAETYKVINSALTGDEGYLKAMMTGLVKDKADTSTGGVKKATKEAYLHAGQIDKAIKHIMEKETFQGITYRGESYPVAQMKQIYKAKSIKFPNYVSTSKLRSKGDEFMRGGLGNQSRPLGILWKIQVTKGADIADISTSSQEKEVLLPRNTTFEILKRKKHSEKAGKWWELEVRQK